MNRLLCLPSLLNLHLFSLAARLLLLHKPLQQNQASLNLTVNQLIWMTLAHLFLLEFLLSATAATHSFLAETLKMTMPQTRAMAKMTTPSWKAHLPRSPYPVKMTTKKVTATLMVRSTMITPLTVATVYGNSGPSDGEPADGTQDNNQQEGGDSNHDGENGNSASSDDGSSVDESTDENGSDGSPSDDDGYEEEEVQAGESTFLSSFTGCMQSDVCNYLGDSDQANHLHGCLDSQPKLSSWW
jgi:hypothetical protein